MNRLQESIKIVIPIMILIIIMMSLIAIQSVFAIENFQDTNQDINLELKTNNENISNINNESITEETQDSWMIEDLPPIDKYAVPIEDVEPPILSEENITIDTDTESEKFVPEGEHISTDMSIYSENELKLINLVLDKIDKNKTSTKKTEVIKLDFDMDIDSCYRAASYFYIYYGKNEAANKTFNVSKIKNYFTGKDHTFIKIRYDYARKFESNMDIIKLKADEILSSFEAGSDVYILRQISEYLRDNIEYVPGSHDINSALIDGKTVCNGYALAFNLLANRAGIKSDICIALMDDGIYHAWNRVTMSDGSQYFYDITYFDASNSDMYTHSPAPLHTTDYLINSYVDSWFKK